MAGRLDTWSGPVMRTVAELSGLGQGSKQA